MGSPWLPTGSYSVRMKRAAPKKLFKPLPGSFSIPKRPQKSNIRTNPSIFVKNWVGGMGGALTITCLARDDN